MTDPTQTCAAVLDMADKLAEADKYQYVQAFHIIRSILAHEKCVAFKIMNSLNIDISLFESTSSPDKEHALWLPLAQFQARIFGHNNHVGTEHLLLAVAAEKFPYLSHKDISKLITEHWVASVEKARAGMKCGGGK